MTSDVYTLDASADLYPERLKRIYGELALPSLRARGNSSLLAMPSAGFCGSRKASEKGLAVAQELAALLAEHGVAVVSGYARGVDTQAHRAALEVGGTTIVSLPEGMASFRVKRELAGAWDEERTLVLSQYPDEAIWRADRAMERNKVIVGISDVAIVIEAGATGGTLDAGMTALKLGVPLFVATYSDSHEMNEGNRLLLSAGAMTLGRNPKTLRPNVEKILPFLRAGASTLPSTM